MTYREFIIDTVHAIVATWPDNQPKIVRIQQDNATPHIKTDDPAFLEVTNFYAQPENGGWDITLHFQPPNSPDFNILDLAMFRAMQSLQWQHQMRNIDELVQVVKQCWADFPLITSQKVWTSLQLVYDACLKAGGTNNYKLPHMNKDKWVRENGCPLPLRLPCTALQADAVQAQDPEPLPQEENNEQLADDNEIAALTDALQDVALQDVAEMGIDWEDIGNGFDWDPDDERGVATTAESDGDDAAMDVDVDGADETADESMDESVDD